MSIEYNVDEPKYRKSKHSNRSKSSKKSNHKHEYYTVLLKTISDKPGYRSHYYSGKRCSICGKLEMGGENLFVRVDENGHRYYRLWTEEEILEKYGHLEIYEYKW